MQLDTRRWQILVEDIECVQILYGLAYRQNKQEENQRKYFAGVSGIVIGVLLAVGTSAFGLMSDTMGFGNLIDKGIDSDLQLDQGQSGRGLKDPKTNW